MAPTPIDPVIGAKSHGEMPLNRAELFGSKTGGEVRRLGIEKAGEARGPGG